MGIDERRRKAAPPMLLEFDLQRFATGNAGKPAGSDGPRRRGAAPGGSGKARKGSTQLKEPNRPVVTELPRPRGAKARGSGQPAQDQNETAVTTRRMPPRVDPEVERRTVKYIVQPGDTLYKLARQFGTTTRELATLNHLHKPTLLLPGDVLLIPD